MVAVPDVVMLEGVANGQETPDTWRLVRHDGRVAYMYARPEEVPA